MSGGLIFFAIVAFLVIVAILKTAVIGAIFYLLSRARKF